MGEFTQWDWGRFSFPCASFDRQSLTFYPKKRELCTVDYPGEWLVVWVNFHNGIGAVFLFPALRLTVIR
jgi:hypothetical protein